MNYRVILMDADDTLFDFRRAEDAAIRRLCELHRIPDADAVVPLYSRINLAQWKRLEQGEITQSELRVERFAELSCAWTAARSGRTQPGLQPGTRRRGLSAGRGALPLPHPVRIPAALHRHQRDSGNPDQPVQPLRTAALYPRDVRFAGDRVFQAPEGIFR